MLRISLIIAIVASLAAAGLNFYQVRQVMLDTMNDRDAERSAKEQALTELSQTKSTLAKTEEELGTTKTKLASTESELKSKSAALASKEQEAAQLSAQLAQTKNERDTAHQKLTQWELLRLSPEQVKAVIAELKTTKEERDAVQGENKLLSKKNQQLENKLASLLNPEEAVALPEGLKGNIIAVDPKYDFVVLDIGEEKGVLERGEMLVNRNGKLVGKIRIAAVLPGQSIANVLPEWKRDDVIEGDQVLY